MGSQVVDSLAYHMFARCMTDSAVELLRSRLEQALPGVMIADCFLQAELLTQPIRRNIELLAAVDQHLLEVGIASKPRRVQPTTSCRPSTAPPLATALSFTGGGRRLFGEFLLQSSASYVLRPPPSRPPYALRAPARQCRRIYFTRLGNSVGPIL